MNNLLPCHPQYKSQLEATKAIVQKQQQLKTQTKQQELLASWNAADKHKRKTLWRNSALLQAMFENPATIKPRKRRVDYATCAVIEIYFYSKSNTFYIRGLDKYVPALKLMEHLSTETRPIKITNRHNNSDMTNDFLYRILQYKATEAIKALPIEQLHKLYSNQSFSESLTVFLTELAVKQG